SKRLPCGETLPAPDPAAEPLRSEIAMLVVSIAGSPGTRSRSGELLNYAAQHLQRRGVEVVSYRVRDFAAEDLLHARFDSPQVRQLLEHVQQADGLIIATPVYKASFSGALKALLD